MAGICLVSVAVPRGLECYSSVAACLRAVVIEKTSACDSNWTGNSSGRGECFGGKLLDSELVPLC